MAKKKLLFFSIFIIIILVFVLTIYNIIYKNNNIYLNNKDEAPNFISIMLEETASSGEYKVSKSNKWPSKGYIFNNEMSYCNNGSTLTWNENDNSVSVNINKTDKCYVYFDIYVPTLVEYVKSQYTGTQGENGLYYHDSTLANGAGDNSYRYAGGDYVLTEAGKATGATMMIGYNNEVTTALIDFYYSGTKQYVGSSFGASGTTYYYLIKGDTTKYQTYHEALNASVEKGYLTKDNVKNFVCFGSDATPCPTENLYRIIGVFNNQVKLIKWDYAKSNLLGTDGDYSIEYTVLSYSGKQGESPLSTTFFYWNAATSRNTWSESNLNKVNLNTNFINNIGATWANKIATTTWKVGGTSEIIYYLIPKTAYQYEVGSSASSTTYDAKIGLMYVTDYYYSASPSAWTLVGYDSDYTKSYVSVKGENWLYGGAEEWTISPYSTFNSGVFSVRDEGGVLTSDAKDTSIGEYGCGVRPSFYLLPLVTYVSGSGTSSDPIRIN